MCSVASSRSCLLCGLQCLVLVPAVPCCLEDSQTCALICLGLEGLLIRCWRGREVASPRGCFPFPKELMSQVVKCICTVHVHIQTVNQHLQNFYGLGVFLIPKKCYNICKASNTDLRTIQEKYQYSFTACSIL